jgi:hypothetical protein
LDWLRYQVFLLRKAIVLYLEKKERKLSMAQKKIYLLVFVLTFGGFYVWCLISGITGQSTSTLKVSTIKRPLVKHQLNQDSVRNLK